jgi:hypothetical protein
VNVTEVIFKDEKPKKQNCWRKQEVTEIFAVEEDDKPVQTTVTVIDDDEPT